MNSDPQTFVDPLENYDPKSYSDPLEKAIIEDTVARVQHQPHASISVDASVGEAVTKLANEHVACLVVEDDGKLAGLFTHREVLNKVALEDLSDKPLREVMTTDPTYVREDDPIAAALCVMAVHGYRHVPIVDAEKKVLGIISPQRITGFLSQAFA